MLLLWWALILQAQLISAIKRTGPGLVSRTLRLLG